jgi:hypothetical protein
MKRFLQSTEMLSTCDTPSQVHGNTAKLRIPEIMSVDFQGIGFGVISYFIHKLNIQVIPRSTKCFLYLVEEAL